LCVESREGDFNAVKQENVEDSGEAFESHIGCNTSHESTSQLPPPAETDNLSSSELPTTEELLVHDEHFDVVKEDSCKSESPESFVHFAEEENNKSGTELPKSNEGDAGNGERCDILKEDNCESEPSEPQVEDTAHQSAGDSAEEENYKSGTELPISNKGDAGNSEHCHIMKEENYESEPSEPQVKDTDHQSSGNFAEEKNNESGNELPKSNKEDAGNSEQCDIMKEDNCENEPSEPQVEDTAHQSAGHSAEEENYRSRNKLVKSNEGDTGNSEQCDILKEDNCKNEVLEPQVGDMAYQSTGQFAEEENNISGTELPKFNEGNTVNGEWCDIVKEEHVEIEMTESPAACDKSSTGHSVASAGIVEESSSEVPTEEKPLVRGDILIVPESPEVHAGHADQKLVIETDSFCTVDTKNMDWNNSFGTVCAILHFWLVM